MTPPNWTPSLSDVTPHWAKSVAQAGDSVVAFFPYVTSLQVINKIPADIPLELYTVFSIENFASGASSYQVLRKIFKRPNTRIYHLEGLHAKMVFVDGDLISLGSQNLTARGAKNLEATVTTSDKLSPRQRNKLEEWRSQAVLLTEKMMQEMHDLLPDTQRHYETYRNEIAAAEERVTRALELYTKERLEFEMAVQVLQSRHDRNVIRLKKVIDECGVDIDRDEALMICKNCVKISAGGYFRPGKSFENTLFNVPGLGLCWNNSGERNTNKFSLSIAHETAIKYISIFYKNAWWEKYSSESIHDWIRDAVGQKSVFNSVHKPFPKYGEGIHQTKEFYTFGKDRFSLRSFVDYYFRMFHIGELYHEWERLKGLTNPSQENSDAP